MYITTFEVPAAVAMAEHVVTVMQGLAVQARGGTGRAGRSLSGWSMRRRPGSKRASSRPYGTVLIGSAEVSTPFLSAEVSTRILAMVTTQGGGS